jgi:hypothetical protein
VYNTRIELKQVGHFQSPRREQCIKDGNKMKLILTMVVLFFAIPAARAEFRTAKDMQKECRVAVKVLDGTAEKNFENVLFTGECVGYIKGAVDGSQVLADNASWYRVCTPDNLSTAALIKKFIAFVDAFPKYTLASTAVQMMLAQEYACKK